jgi:hypothetical protein
MKHTFEPSNELPKQPLRSLRCRRSDGKMLLRRKQGFEALYRMQSIGCCHFIDETYIRTQQRAAKAAVAELALPP